MTESIKVTEATADDAGAFSAFLWEAWQQAGPNAPGFTGASDDVVRELTTRTAVVDRLGGPDRRMFLAWAGPRAIGFSATTRIDTESVELAGIIVLQSMGGQGTGTALVAKTVLACRREGYRRMVVRTETSNDRALGFYEAQGFTRSHETSEDVDGTPVAVWELQRSL